ncbi:MAG: hypothetical protein WBB76_01220 [Gaiellaceae bacterium]
MARALGTRHRFVIAYVLLAAAVGSAAGAFIVLVERPAAKPPAAWSSWKPSRGSSAETAQLIATHVGGSYRLSSGLQLARVVVGVPGLNGNGLQAIALARGLNQVSLYDPRKSILYILCGDSSNCKIHGNPTVGRGTALRREALELALYTLKYANADDVVIFFPPGPGEKTIKSAFFFRRDDLSRQLDVPLRTTLPQAQPPLPGQIDRREKRTVNELTGGRRFSFAMQTAQTGGRVLVLQPAA